MPIGDRIKQVRKATGLTQDQFGKRLCVTFQAISKFEKGTSGPSDQTINLICREFGVNEAWLRTGEGEPYPPPESVTLDSLVSGAGLDGHEADFARKFLRMFRLLRPDTRQDIMERFDEIFGGPQPASGENAAPVEQDVVLEGGEEDVPLTEAEIEEKVAAYRALLKKGRAVRLALGHGTPPQTKASGDTFGSGMDGGGPMA